MSDEAKGNPTWRKPKEPMPWGKFWWRDFLADGRTSQLSHEQRGRFLLVWCFTHGTSTPGVMTEEQVRAWAGYTPKEWKTERRQFAAAFKVTNGGRWIIERVRDDQKAAQNAAQVRLRVSAAGVAKRRAGKDLSTAGATDGQPAVQQPVDKTQTQTSENQTTDKPEVRGSTQTALARVGSAGSAGAPRLETLGGILARAGVSNGNGGSGRKGA